MKTLSTKRALFASVLSFLLCVTMLVGSTFAWFTDTATASVNSIKAGTLDVSLEMLDNDGNWVSAEGKTLQFLVDGKIPTEGTEILWEPGCTYSLPKLRVTNDGNLALKYKVVITGIQGDAELNDVIDWTIGDAAVGENKSLAPQASAEFTITGRMQATAGNAYQGKTIDGIAVSVYATQDTAEKDSNGSTYDAGADMTPDNLDQLLVNGVAVSDLTSALKAATDGSTITFRKSTAEPLQLNLTELTELKGVTFEAAPGVEVKGMKLISESSKTRLELTDVTFKNISFTDSVLIGQDKSSAGLSKCVNITFDHCKFDMAAASGTYSDAIRRMGATGNESTLYTQGLTVKNCEFVNARYGVFFSAVRNLTVENCTFTDCSSYAVRIDNLVGNANISNNTVKNAKGVLQINTVGNNYNTSDITTDVVIKNNTATGMTCKNGYVFYTTYDNARKSGKSTYTITGNSCTYTETFAEEPLNGFRIVKNYGPSAAEFIPNTNG